MKRLFLAIITISVMASCDKDDSPVVGCDMNQVYTTNATKVTITNGF